MSASLLETLLGDAARQGEARARLRSVLDDAPTTMNYMQWRRRLPAAERIRRVAVLSSFTVETMAPYLDVEAFAAGWRIAPRFEQYGEWRTAWAAPGRLGEPAPEACIILLHGDAVLSRDEGGAMAGVDWLLDLLRGFRAQSTIPLFVGLLAEPPARHALGLGEGPAAGRPRALALARDSLVTLALELDDIHLLDVPAWLGAETSEVFDGHGYLNNLSLLNGRGMAVVARGIARHAGCLFRPRRKVLAVDLDDTLWGGIVGEDGVDGIALGETWPGPAYLAFQRTLRDLRRSGIVLAICSKNEEADARAVFARRPEIILAWDDFNAYRINWRNKAENLIELAEELGLGLDSFVFADDNPKECGLVRQALPMVEVVELGKRPEAFSDRLLACQAFDVLGITREDAIRAESYRHERRRADLAGISVDLDSFYRSMELRLSIRPAEARTLDRIHKLLNKTNQFNLTLDRPTLDEIRRRVDAESHIYSAELSDRFGDHGIIAALELRSKSDRLCIANMAVSCRALGCLVEDSLLAFSSAQAHAQGAAALVADFVPGPRNGQVPEALRRLGFSAATEGGEGRHFVCQLADGGIANPPHIAIEAPNAGAAD